MMAAKRISSVPKTIRAKVVHTQFFGARWGENDAANDEPCSPDNGCGSSDEKDTSGMPRRHLPLASVGTLDSLERPASHEEASDKLDKEEVNVGDAVDVGELTDGP